MISLILLLALWLSPDRHSPDCPCDGCCMERSGDTEINLTPVKP